MSEKSIQLRYALNLYPVPGHYHMKHANIHDTGANATETKITHHRHSLTFLYPITIYTINPPINQGPAGARAPSRESAPALRCVRAKIQVTKVRTKDQMI